MHGMMNLVNHSPILHKYENLLEDGGEVISSDQDGANEPEFPCVKGNENLF